MADRNNNGNKMKRTLQLAEKAQFIGLILISLVLITGVDLIVGEMGWENITDPYFYIRNFITGVAMLLITFATTFFALDHLKESNQTYCTAKDEINAFAISRDNIPSVLSKFLEHLNRKRKINQYEHNVLMKIYNLENKQKWYAYIPIVKWFVKNPYYYTEEEMHIWNFGTEEEKAKSKYCRKRKMYEEQLSPELIEKTIDTKHVNYDKITTAILLSDYYNKNDRTRANDFVTKNETEKIAQNKIPALLFSFGVTFLMTSLVLDSFSINWLSLITLGTKAVTIAWNIFTSIRYAKKHFNNITLHDIVFRRSIIQEYYKWLSQEAAKNIGQSQAKEEQQWTPTN